MLVTGDKFPYRAITDAEQLIVERYCGGPPVDDLELARNFLSTSGIPVVNHYPIWQLILNTRISTVGALDLSTDNSMLAFNRGAYFYAGVVHELSGVQTIPVENAVITDVSEQIDERPFDFGLELTGRINDVPSFKSVFELVRPVLIGGNKDDYNTALLGAGAIHYLYTESMASMQTSESLTSNHPELDGLFDPFKEPPSID